MSIKLLRPFFEKDLRSDGVAAVERDSKVTPPLPSPLPEELLDNDERGPPEFPIPIEVAPVLSVGPEFEEVLMSDVEEEEAEDETGSEG